MVWIILIVVTLLLIKIGVLSTLVAALSMALKTVIVIVAALGLLVLWIEHRQ